MLNLSDFSYALEKLPEGLAHLRCAGISADSRKIRPGELFFCLPAAHAGNVAPDLVRQGRERERKAAHIRDALERKAAAIVINAGDYADHAHSAYAPYLLSAIDARGLYALMAREIYPLAPKHIAAVTGTAGKSSTVEFARQLWRLLEIPAASIGTLGVLAEGLASPTTLTSPDALELHRNLTFLKDRGVTHLALEASSHGLDQRRLDGVPISAAAFTQLGRDHLDYHPDMSHYLASKMRLFGELLPPGAPVIIDPAAEGANEVMELCRQRKHRLITIGPDGQELKLLDHRQMPEGRQRLMVDYDGKSFALLVNLPGRFQVMNLLTAAALVLALGAPAELVMRSISQVRAICGRYERVGRSPAGSDIIIDYAHKPEALLALLNSLRAETKGRIILVLGAGGERDRGKRQPMGQIASRAADFIIITDDNPRHEDPAAIRADLISAITEPYEEIADRRQAISRAIDLAGAGDAVCIAGKGHEKVQIIGDERMAFDDHEVVLEVLGAKEIAS